MSNKLSLERIDLLNNRILVRNSHKLVYKKLCVMNRNEWCQKYLSVATSKLADPQSMCRLPISLTKKNRKLKTEGTLMQSCNASVQMQRRQSQILAPYENQLQEQCRTIEDEKLMDASERAERLLERMRKSVAKPRPRLHFRSHNTSVKRSKQKGVRDEYEIEPWGIDRQDPEDKQNRFFLH